jgi:hypothetical protein
VAEALKAVPAATGTAAAKGPLAGADGAAAAAAGRSVMRAARRGKCAVGAACALRP